MSNEFRSWEDEGKGAFPIPDVARERGMSLRDYFAGQVMAQMIALSMDRDGAWSTENVAAGCYNLADAMLAERMREKTP